MFTEGCISDYVYLFPAAVIDYYKADGSREQKFILSQSESHKCRINFTDLK
jgi:hypothetical protein